MMKFFSVTVLAMTLLMVVPQGHAACTEQSLDATDSIFGQLSESDCPINELIGGLDESKADVFSLVIAATTTVSISMTSESFDAFLLVYNSDYSSVLAEDDDSGDNLDAVVEDLVLAPGTYHILANSSTQQAVFGSYTLSFVSEVAVDTVIVSSVLPSSRSVQVGSPATAFATIINASAVTATNCGLALRSSIDADFSYQTTNPATNQSVGSADTPADIGAGLYQSYIFTITPNSAFPPQEVELDYRCLNSLSAATVVGLNTLLLSGNNTSVPDVVALVATPVDPGFINLPDTKNLEQPKKLGLIGAGEVSVVSSM